MLPIGIVSIPRSSSAHAAQPFETLMSAIGYNSGNLLFTHAVWEQVAGPKQRVGFTFDPDTLNTSLRALVIPAANWVSPLVDFSDLAARVEKLDIPVILIGLGAQSAQYSRTIDVPEGTIRFIRAAALRSRKISVRGDYTRKILAGYGITNTLVTGCPSLYTDFSNGGAARLGAQEMPVDGPLLLHSTRYSAGHKPFTRKKTVHREIFRYAYRTSTDLLLQSETEEISLLAEASDKPELDWPMMKQMVMLYNASDWASLSHYISAHTKVYFDIASWAEAVGTYAGVFGTRLHATIMALNSGVPALLVPHDSRTREMAEFASIPSLPESDVRLDAEAIRGAIRSADFGAYLARRRQNAAAYTAFLADNGLEPALSEMAGIFPAR